MATDLDYELEVYNREKPQLLLENEGKYVLIHKDTIDVFETYNEALITGYQKYGRVPFMVKQILEVEPVIFIPTFWIVDDNKSSTKI